MTIVPQRDTGTASCSDVAAIECPYPLYDQLLEEHAVYSDAVTGIYAASRLDDVRSIADRHYDAPGTFGIVQYAPPRDLGAMVRFNWSGARSAGGEMHGSG